MSKDRNDLARQQEAHRRARASFAQALSGGQAAPLDRFGAPLKVGDLVLHRPDFDFVFQIVDIAPPVDPRVPVGMAVVSIAMTSKLTFPVNQAQPRFVRCGHTSADGQHSEFTSPVVGDEASEATGADTAEPDLSPDAILDADAPPQPPAGPRLVLTDGTNDDRAPVVRDDSVDTVPDLPKDDSDGRD